MLVDWLGGLYEWQIWLFLYLCGVPITFLIGWALIAAELRSKAEEEGTKPKSALKECGWRIFGMSFLWPLVWSFSFAWAVTHTDG